MSGFNRFSRRLSDGCGREFQIVRVWCEVLDCAQGLIAEIGRASTPGQPRLFGTTLRFLQLVGLERVDQLPPLPGGIGLPEEQERAWSEALTAPPEDEPAPPARI